MFTEIKESKKQPQRTQHNRIQFLSTGWLLIINNMIKSMIKKSLNITNVTYLAFFGSRFEWLYPVCVGVKQKGGLLAFCGTKGCLACAGEVCEPYPSEFNWNVKIIRFLYISTYTLYRRCLLSCFFYSAIGFWVRLQPELKNPFV